MFVFPPDKKDELTGFLAQNQRAQRRKAHQTLMSESSGSMLGLIAQVSLVQNTILCAD